MKQKMVFFVLLVCMVFSINMATVDAKTKACSYEIQAELNKIASDVEVGYEFVYDSNKKVIGFDITIYNITEKIYVTYTDDSKESKTVNVSYGDTNNGIYTFRTNNINDVVTYSFSVNTNYYACGDYISRFDLIKPKNNLYHYKDYCNDERLENYFYCKEWITRNIDIPELEIKEEIEKIKKITKQVTTTKCKDCDKQKEVNEEKDKLLTYKWYIIGGIIFVMIVDVVLMYVKIVNIRRSEL